MPKPAGGQGRIMEKRGVADRPQEDAEAVKEVLKAHRQQVGELNMAQ